MKTGESDSTIVGKILVGALLIGFAPIWFKPEASLKGSRPEAPEPPDHGVTDRGIEARL